MKVKTYAIVALAALVTISASAAIAREYFENEPVAKQPVKVVRTQPVVVQETVYAPSYDYPVSPKDKKRIEAIFYWKPQGVVNSRYDNRYVSEPRYKINAPRAYSQVVYVSDYPCNRCVLNTAGKYELDISRGN